MSTEFFLVDHVKKQYLWIGAEYMSGFGIYLGNKDCQIGLKKILSDKVLEQSPRLFSLYSEYEMSAYDGYEEIKWEFNK